MVNGVESRHQANVWPHFQRFTQGRKCHIRPKSAWPLIAVGPSGLWCIILEVHSYKGRRGSCERVHQPLHELYKTSGCIFKGVTFKDPQGHVQCDPTSKVREQGTLDRHHLHAKAINACHKLIWEAPCCARLLRWSSN